KVEKGKWESKDWGENYFCATFANTFLSRKGFISLPETCEESIASLKIRVQEDGKYLVLCRYERVHRFNTIFRIRIEQKGNVIFDRVYGDMENLKIWPWYRLQKEIAFDWGAVENIVWEGHDAYVDLVKGDYKISLIGGKQPEPAAKRNIDVILITKDEEQVKNRIQKESYLPLDGWLTQLDDVWIKVENKGTKEATINLTFQEHSPYWVHMRIYKKPTIKVAGGEKTDWIEVGGIMDTLNDGQFTISSKNETCEIEIGIKDATGKIESIRKVKIDADKSIVFNGLANLRYIKQLNTVDEEKEKLVNYIKNLKPHGKKPEKTLILANTINEFFEIYGIKKEGGVFIIAHGWDVNRAIQWCEKLSEEERKKVLVVSLGDEISLPYPSKKDVEEKFIEYLKSQGLDFTDFKKDSWDKVKFGVDQDTMKNEPIIYYWSKKFQHDFGINKIKEVTDVFRKFLPNAGIGANFSPHHGGYEHSYLGETYKWINCFRKEGMTMPWSEDYIWQVPVGSPQMNGINLDLFRSGIKGKDWMKIHYYVMPHTPGNIPSMWKRLFFQSLAHGMKVINLFEFVPVYLAYTENHVNDYKMYEIILRSFYEYGIFEDIVQEGRVKDGEVALLFSETADIWKNNLGSYASNKRAMYITIKNQQIPLDIINEDDFIKEEVMRYKIIFVLDKHISNQVSKKMEKYLQNGGILFFVCGTGMYDEYNKSNSIISKLLGFEYLEIIEPKESQVYYIKQDLPFANPITKITELNNEKVNIPVFGAISRIRVKDTKRCKEVGFFENGLPAITITEVGKGKIIYCAFLPGLSYFYPAIPKRPVDRGNMETSFSHFMPTDFEKKLGEFIRSLYNGEPYVYVKNDKNEGLGFIENGVIESKNGKVILLINWSD
ncbi:MAG: beta-galactosidase trimerization domain-containing protein, partial [bacterium]|nr:beta-galactosidase trimerization domain-containing protein [bacterium]MDW8164217.1 beta-galactosidase trimerization domain-containing protein [Candidatus Omnitrophota bacterium]